MTISGSVDRDGFALDWVREGSGIPMLIVGPPRYYQRVFLDELYNEFEIVFGNIRAFVPPPEGFDVTTLTRDTFADDIGRSGRPQVWYGRSWLVTRSWARLCLSTRAATPTVSRGWRRSGHYRVGTKKQMPHVWEFFEQDADAERRAAHEHNLATRRVPAATTTGRDYADQYIAQGALYWYDPTFDASPLWDGVEPQAAITSHIFDTLFAEYDLPPLDVPVFVALGRFDYAVPYDLWDEEQTQHLSKVHYKLYDDSGHTPPYGVPQRFTADITAWAQSL